jgi:hypothetical protein
MEMWTLWSRPHIHTKSFIYSAEENTGIDTNLEADGPLYIAGTSLGGGCVLADSIGGCAPVTVLLAG